jgi:hypothetical protein
MRFCDAFGVARAAKIALRAIAFFLIVLLLLQWLTDVPYVAPHSPRQNELSANVPRQSCPPVV